MLPPIKQTARLLWSLFAIIIFCAATWALYRELRNYHWVEFRRSLHEIRASRIALAIMLAVADSAILVGNDILASHFVGRRVPFSKLAAASIAGYAASHNLGAALGGTPVRYRFYTSWGLTASQIASWIAMLMLSFAMGASLVGGVTSFLRSDVTWSILPLPLKDMRAIGTVLLALPVVYLVLCATGRRLRWRSWDFRLPSARIGLLQIAVGSADLCCAGSILYMLLPATSSVSYASFLNTYLLVAVLSVCSHVPGGVGVFDLVMIKMLNHGDPHGMLAALLIYRAAYYLFPLAIGLLLFAAHEISLRHSTRAVLR